MASSRSRAIALFAALLAVPALSNAGSARAAGGDPLLKDQWALNDPSLGAPAAWSQSLGDGVVVAVLDSGVQLDHPDLAGNLWTNLGERPGNGIDDDRNGFVDDVHGANLLTHDGDVGDDRGHGTHVAGIVAAIAGNGVGGSGLAPRASATPPTRARGSSTCRSTASPPPGSSTRRSPTPAAAARRSSPPPATPGATSTSRRPIRPPRRIPRC
jgi:subtilisin family serine protease